LAGATSTLYGLLGPNGSGKRRPSRPRWASVARSLMKVWPGTGAPQILASGDSKPKWIGGTGMKILIIEDDAKTAAYVANGFEEHGHVVDQAANGRDGLFLAAGEPYDLLIVDRMLPGLDGLAVVKTIRSAGVKTPVLFLTTLGGIDDRVEGLEAGGDDYLVKPFALAELVARVNALVRRPPMTAVNTVLNVADLEMNLLKRS
jgi:CheY-like chemotaxis protein